MFNLLRVKKRVIARRASEASDSFVLRAGDVIVPIARARDFAADVNLLDVSNLEQSSSTLWLCYAVEQRSFFLGTIHAEEQKCGWAEWLNKNT